VITKGERTELSGIVRRQFKVLRSELEQRRLELYAEVETRIEGKFADEDQAWSVAMHEVHEATMEANRRINDAMREFMGDERAERMWISLPRLAKPLEARTDMRREAKTRIDAEVKGAQLRLERHEVDLLRTLATGALESGEARDFLAAIPSVGELVSTARLAELEASFDDEPQ
jgi:hypothetical protein